jgi:hypothetical protein
MPSDSSIVVADRKWKYVLYSAVCWGLVFAGFLTINAKERHWQFWIAEVVMLAFALGLSYMLLNKKYKFIGRTGPAMDAYLAGKYEDLLTDHGSFTYTSDGFVFKAEDNDIEVLWDEINRISGHLEDVVSNDEDLCLRIEYGENHFLEFDEEMPGWLLFRHKMRERFGFGPEWQDSLLESGSKEIEIWRKSPNP